jgi:hypothetical protein
MSISDKGINFVKLVLDVKIDLYSFIEQKI